MMTIERDAQAVDRRWMTLVAGHVAAQRFEKVAKSVGAAQRFPGLALTERSADEAMVAVRS